MTNKQRIAKAKNALKTYHDGDDLQSPVVDLITDLQHYCKKHNIDFDNALTIANGHFRTESINKRLSSAKC